MREKTDFVAVVFVWIAGLGAAGQYAKVSAAFDHFREVYPDAGIALGFVVSIVGLVGVVLGVVGGVVVARLRFRRMLLWGLWAGAVLSLAQATLPSVSVMLLLRGIEGISHLVLVIAAPILIGQLSAEKDRPLTLSLWSTFFSVCFAMVVYLGLPLVQAYGLQALFLVHAGWMAACALILSRLLPRGLVAQGQERLTVGFLVREHGAIYCSPFIATPGIVWLFYTFCFLALLTLLPPYIVPAWRAIIIGAMPLVAIAASMTVGVALLQRMEATRVVVIGFVLAVVSSVWLWLDAGSIPACLALAAALGLIQGANFAAVPQLNPEPGAQSQAYGALAQMGNLGNTFGTPALLFVASLGGYSAMMLCAIAVFVAGIALQLWLAGRRAAALN